MTRPRTVRWVGRRTIATACGPRADNAPVEIAADAFGPGLPARPLRLTAGHALLLDGLLVQAGALDEGGTARRLTAADVGDRQTVFHVETEAHDLLLAEGVPAETFVHTVTRARFEPSPAPGPAAAPQRSGTRADFFPIGGYNHPLHMCIIACAGACSFASEGKSDGDLYRRVCLRLE